MLAKLAEVKDQITRPRHLPIPEQGAWFGSVVRGGLAYDAVPGNIDVVAAFRDEMTRLWFEVLRCHSQMAWIDWSRMRLYVSRWLLPAPCTPSRSCASTFVLKAGAQCVSSARWDLCGGRPQPDSSGQGQFLLGSSPNIARISRASLRRLPYRPPPLWGRQRPRPAWARTQASVGSDRRCSRTR